MRQLAEFSFNSWFHGPSAARYARFRLPVDRLLKGERIRLTPSQARRWRRLVRCQWHDCRCGGYAPDLIMESEHGRVYIPVCYDEAPDGIITIQRADAW